MNGRRYRELRQHARASLVHAERTAELLAEGKRAEAIEAHNARVASELQRAEAGEVICLSDLMAAREEIEIDSAGWSRGAGK